MAGRTHRRGPVHRRAAFELDALARVGMVAPMCGRFTLTVPASTLVAHFGLAEALPLVPRFNVAPSQPVAVVGLKPDQHQRGLGMLRWGLVPQWTTDPKTCLKPINARAETLTSKPTFRDLFLQRRCIIPSDGFFEWQQHGKTKTPHHIRRQDRVVFGVAGLWDVWRGHDGKLATCCLVTVAANPLIQPIHERMPVILSPDSYAAWLSPRTTEKELLELLRPFPAELLECVPVGPIVNSPRNDAPECLIPLSAPWLG